MLSPEKTAAIKLLVSKYFKNSKGEPYKMVDGECEMFESVVNPDHKWVWLSAPTRYGKTETLALALIYLAVFHDLKIPVVAGSLEKANKIMEYIVQHIGDHSQLYQGLINLELTSVEKLKVKVTQEALRWHKGGWIYITSIESKNIKKEGESVVGEGGDVVVLEEAGLIKQKNQFSKIVRMPEEDRGWGKLIMSGNCIENSVFEDGWNSDLYLKIRVTLEQAIKEGRFTQAYLDQKKTQTTTKDWKRYYLVAFPAANEFTYFKPKKMEFLPTKGLTYYGACDPNLGETNKGSLAGLVVLGVDGKGQVYEVETIGLPLGPDNTINTIFNFPYKFNRFGVEKVQFQKYFLNEMDKKSKELGLYIPFVGLEQKRKKEERIESLEPIINTGQILFRGDNLLWVHMQDYPESEHLDILDALEMCWRLAAGSKVDFAFI